MPFTAYICAMYSTRHNAAINLSPKCSIFAVWWSTAATFDSNVQEQCADNIRVVNVTRRVRSAIRYVYLLTAAKRLNPVNIRLSIYHASLCACDAENCYVISCYIAYKCIASLINCCYLRIDYSYRNSCDSCDLQYVRYRSHIRFVTGMRLIKMRTELDLLVKFCEISVLLKLIYFFYYYSLSNLFSVGLIFMIDQKCQNVSRMLCI